MRLVYLDLVRTLVGQVSKLLLFESLDIAKVPSIPLDIFGVRFSASWVVVIILR